MITLLSSLKIALTWLGSCLILLLSIVINGNVYASSVKTNDVAQLVVTPKPCVALRKGQKCYLKVTFNWQHPNVSNYCLVNLTKNTILKCWQQRDKGEFSFDFQSTLTNEFALRAQESTLDIVQATIPVAWVYQSSKRAKSTWRLF